MQARLDLIAGRPFVVSSDPLLTQVSGHQRSKDRFGDGAGGHPCAGLAPQRALSQLPAQAPGGLRRLRDQGFAARRN